MDHAIEFSSNKHPISQVLPSCDSDFKILFKLFKNVKILVVNAERLQLGLTQLSCRFPLIEVVDLI